MNTSSWLKLLLVSAAALTSSYFFISNIKTSELESKVKISPKQEDKLQLWGEISPDFNTCATASLENDNVAQSRQSLNYKTASIQPNNIVVEKSKHDTIELCQ